METQRERLKLIRKKIYRKSVAAIVLNKGNKVLVAEKSDVPDAFQFPQGGMSKDESEEEAILRELKEELGSDKFEIILKGKKTYRYDFPEEVKKIFENKYDGQEQRYFLIRFTGNDNEINLTSSDTEFKSFKWIPFSEDIYKNIIEFKRKVYKEVFNDFKDIINNLKKGDFEKK